MPYPSKWLLFTIAMIFIGLNATAAQANIFTITCKRTVLNIQSFAKKSHAESWFPIIFTTSALNFQPISDDQRALRHRRTVTTIQGTNYQFLHTLLPDGRLLANAISRHGYQDIGPSTYHCDKTALEVRKLRKDLPD